MTRTLALSLAAALAGAAAGCSDTNRVSVKGVVRVDGVPIEDGGITFISLSDAPTSGARITNGEFVVPDAVVGPTRLSIDGVRKTGRRVAGRFDGLVDEYEPVVAREYGTPRSPLVVDIQRGQPRLELDVPPAKAKKR